MKKKTIKKLVLAGLVTASVVLAGCIAKERLADSSMPSSAILEKFVESVRKVDGQAEAHYKMALYFQKNRRHKLTIEELKRALALDPAMAKAHNAMGVSYDNLRQYDKAVRCYFVALKIAPDLDYVHNNLGYSQLLRGNHQKAIKAFRHAIRLNGENKRYRNNLALTYVMNDQYDLAAEQFKIFDNQADSDQKLARLLHDLGKAEAHQHLKTRSGEKDHSDTMIVENKPAEPLVIRKKIRLPIEQTQTLYPSRAATEFSVEKSVDVVSTGTSSSEAQPVPEEASKDSGTVSVKDLTTAQPSDSPTNPLYVSAIQIAAGKIAEPADAIPVKPSITNNRPLDDPIPTERKAATHPKIIEVPRTGALSPLHKRLYPIELVAGVVHVRATDSKSSLRAVTPAYTTVAPGESTRSVKSVIEVAAAQLQNSPALVAPPKTKLPREILEVELEIANGNGMRGMARKVGKYLELRGFKVIEIKNAHSFDHLSTKVLYSSGGKRDLGRLLRELAVIRDASNLIELEHLEKRIRVVVGKDMLSMKDQLEKKSSN